LRQATTPKNGGNRRRFEIPALANKTTIATNCSDGARAGRELDVAIMAGTG